MVDTRICPKCKGIGMISFEDTDQKNGMVMLFDGKPIKYELWTMCPECQGGLEEKSIIARNHADIPKFAEDTTIAEVDWTVWKKDGKSCDVSKQRQYIEYYVKNFSEARKEGKGVYLYSETKGSGKTFLASAICNSLINAYAVETRFVSAPELLDIRTEPKDYAYKYGEHPIRFLSDCELLVLDDLGQKKIGKDFMDDVLFRIIDGRIQKKLVTIITSNMKIDALRDKMDIRIVDRINAMCQPIPLPEVCVRSIKADEERKRFLYKSGLLKEAI